MKRFTSSIRIARGRMLRLVAAGLVAGWGVGAAMPARADSREVPDAAQLAELRRVASRQGVLRLMGDFGARNVRRPLLDSTGVRSASWEERARRRPALFVSADAPPPEVPKPIAWSTIEEIQAGRSKALKGALIGTAVGIFTGALLLAGTLDHYAGEDALGALGLAEGAVLSGTIVGLVIGSTRGWHTVYPTPSQED